ILALLLCLRRLLFGLVFGFQLGALMLSFLFRGALLLQLLELLLLRLALALELFGLLAFLALARLLLSLLFVKTPRLRRYALFIPNRRLQRHLLCGRSRSRAQFQKADH